MAHSSSHVLLAEAVNHPPVPQNHVSYRLNLGLGGTYRELYRVLGVLIKGIYYKVGPGLMYPLHSLVYAQVHILPSSSCSGGSDLRVGTNCMGSSPVLREFSWGLTKAPTILNPLRPTLNPSNRNLHPGV